MRFDFLLLGIYIKVSKNKLFAKFYPGGMIHPIETIEKVWNNFLFLP